MYHFCYFLKPGLKCKTWLKNYNYKPRSKKNPKNFFTFLDHVLGFAVFCCVPKKTFRHCTM